MCFGALTKKNLFSLPQIIHLPPLSSVLRFWPCCQPINPQEIQKPDITSFNEVISVCTDFGQYNNCELSPGHFHKR
jgi:hypothetical protein